MHFAVELECDQEKWPAEIIRLLFIYGADQTLKDGYGKTPLELAQEKENQPMIDLLADLQVVQERTRDHVVAKALAMATYAKFGSASPLGIVPQDLLRYISKLTIEAECCDARNPR